MYYNYEVKKALALLVVIVTIVGIVLYQKSTRSDGVAVPPTPTIGSPSEASSSSKTYKDGTYTGDTADAFYGNMQVQIVVSGGKITDINFLQYPNTPGHTTEVNNMALPILKQEAITAQSTNVDVVSGATQTSNAFIESLSSALTKAS